MDDIKEYIINTGEKTKILLGDRLISSMNNFYFRRLAHVFITTTDCAHKQSKDNKICSKNPTIRTEKYQLVDIEANKK